MMTWTPLCPVLIVWCIVTPLGVERSPCHHPIEQLIHFCFVIPLGIPLPQSYPICLELSDP